MSRNNTGDDNSGDRNSGNWNSGDWNSGDWNSGDWNSGNWNSGDWNSGDWNSGNWNSGDWNSGYLNSDKPKIRIFNKDTDVEEITFPDFFYFKLNRWIPKDDMTDKEKEAYPGYTTTGGYLKVKEYKQAWREAYSNTTQEDRDKVKELPNFDADIFKEITGIDIEETEEEIIIDGKKWSKSTIKEALKHHAE